MCGLYLLRKSFEKVKYYYTADNMETDGLREILHDNYWPLLKEEGFLLQLFNKVKGCYEELSRIDNQRNAIALIYAKTLEALKTNKNWTNRNFILSSYKAERANDIRISINVQKMKVKSRHADETLF